MHLVHLLISQISELGQWSNQENEQKIHSAQIPPPPHPYTTKPPKSLGVGGWIKKLNNFKGKERFNIEIMHATDNVMFQLV